MKFIGDFDATLEDYITSLPAVTSIGTGVLSVTASDITLYDATNNGNPTVKIGSSATECLEILSQYESGAQGLDVVKFTTKTAGSSTNDGRFAFYPDEELIFQIRDHGINLVASKSLQINSVDIISDSSGTATLSNIDALDATTVTTIKSAIADLTSVGTISTGVWRGTAIEMGSGGTGLVGATDGKIVVADGSGDPVHLDIGSSTAITTLGTITEGTWNGEVITSAYLDADTVHYSATRQATHHMILDDIDSDVVYISLLESDAENTSVSNKHLPLIAPSNGKLLKIFLRTSVDQSSETFTFKLYTRSTSVSTGGAASEIGAQSGTGPTGSSMVTYDFTTGLDSGTNAINAGDKVLISLQAGDGATANGSYFITCLWEWDFS